MWKLLGAGLRESWWGDRVSVPFNLACGTCKNCNNGFTSACLPANPSGQPGAGYGYPTMGPYWGGQAEYLRIPWVDFNLLRLPEGAENENDFTMLSDIFPTGYHATEMAMVAPGKSVVVFGAGQFGLDRPNGCHGHQFRRDRRRRSSHGSHQRIRCRLRH
ncbi:MAG: alcohol dehydrogenase catalytic domain-containing protein [Specibacter sp.]